MSRPHPLLFECLFHNGSLTRQYRRPAIVRDPSVTFEVRLAFSGRGQQGFIGCGGTFASAANEAFELRDAETKRMENHDFAS
jgi:hypothetical protein